MSDIYKEAIADLKKIKEIAENNAKISVLEMVTPKIKDLIEKQFIENLSDDEDDLDSLEAITEEFSESADVRSTDKDLQASLDENYDIDESTLLSMAPFVDMLNDKFELGVHRMSQSVNSIVTNELNYSVEQIDMLISKMEDMYSYLAESQSLSNRDLLEQKLEACHKILVSLKESKMKMKNLREEKEVTMKIKGLPDDLDLDSLNIDLVTDEDVDSEEPEAPPSDELPAPEPQPEEQLPQAEGDDVDGDVMDEGDEVEDDEGDEVEDDEDDEEIELDESELVAALKSLKAKKASASILDDFGDADSVDLNEKDGDEDGDEDEDEDEDERDLMTDKTCLESDISRLTKKAIRIRSFGKMAESDAKKRLHKKFVSTVSELKEAKASLKKLLIKESLIKKASLAESKVNSVSSNKKTEKELTESGKVNSALRKQLTEMNLINSKLIHANKLLQLNNLSDKSKEAIVDKLDEARSLREVTLVYESLKKTFVGERKKVNETKSHLANGSSSRPTQSSSVKPQPLTERFDDNNVVIETDRWTKLAGLK